VGTRVIAASRHDLAAAVAQGNLHEDLYYLLNVVPLEVPPLREHAEDIPALVEWFIDEFATGENVPFRRCDVAAKNRLRNHPWPGNVRELRNVVQRLMILGRGPDIDARDVEMGLGPAAGAVVPAEDFDLPFKEARENFERAYLIHQFDRPGSNMSEIAARIGIERSHLYRKLKQLGIDRRPAGGRFTA
jgi:DNA-binding NtrC family response regulator